MIVRTNAAILKLARSLGRVRCDATGHTPPASSPYFSALNCTRRGEKKNQRDKCARSVLRWLRAAAAPLLRRGGWIRGSSVFCSIVIALAPLDKSVRTSLSGFHFSDRSPPAPHDRPIETRPGTDAGARFLRNLSHRRTTPVSGSRTTILFLFIRHHFFSGIK